MLVIFDPLGQTDHLVVINANFWRKQHGPTRLVSNLLAYL